MPSKLTKSLSLFLSLCLIFEQTAFAQREQTPQPLPAFSAHSSGSFSLPSPDKLLSLSPKFSLPAFKGLKLYSDDPFKFDFIIDGPDASFKDQELKKEAEKLIKYFLCSLTIPEEDLWVNLSPYEADKVVPDELGLTEMGKDLLGQDYLLKQLMASLTYPESPLGKEFWDRAYQQAYQLWGTSKIPINTFNKIWIVPDKAVVYEDKDRAILGVSRLKVMLEEDYLAFKNRPQTTVHSPQKKIVLTENDEKNINNFSSRIIQEVILPQIEKEVNEGKNFAPLRQIYSALIMATWFKKRLRQSIVNSPQSPEHILNKIYIDKKKIKGVDTDDPQVKEKIYHLYVQAFRKGVYDYIKEDYSPQERRHIKRRYYSGGMNFAGIASSSLEVYPLTQRTSSPGTNPFLTQFSVGLTSSTPSVSSPMEESKEDPLISQIEPIERIHRIITRREELEELVEKPWLEASKILYDKGIRTIMASANKNNLKSPLLDDGRNYAYLIVDYDSLSEENEEIVDRLIQEDYEDIKIDKEIFMQNRRGEEEQLFRILIPITRQSTVNQVSQKAVEIAGLFKKQKVLWAPAITLEGLRKFHGLPEATIKEPKTSSAIAKNKEKLHKKIERWIDSFSKQENYYQKIVEEMTNNISSGKYAQDFKKLDKSLERLEKQYQKGIKDIQMYKAMIGKESTTYEILSHYQEELQSLHQQMSDYFGKELEKIIQLQKEWKVERGKINTPEGLGDLNRLRDEFKEKLADWQKKVQGKKKKIVNLFRELLYGHIFTQGQNLEVLKQAIASEFNNSGSETLRQLATQQIAEKIKKDRILYTDSIGKLLDSLRESQKARLILAQEIGPEIKPILERQWFNQAIIWGSSLLTIIGLSATLWLEKNKYPSPKPEVKQEEPLRGIHPPNEILPKNGDEAKTPPEKVEESSPQQLLTEIMTLIPETPVNTDTIQSKEEQERNEAIIAMEEKIEENLQRLKAIEEKEAQVKEDNKEGMRKLEEEAQGKQPLEKEEPPTQDIKDKKWHKPQVDMEADAGSSSEGLSREYPKPPVDTSRKSRIGFTGNNFSFDWVAQSTEDGGYLGELSYRGINPVTGEFFPSSERNKEKVSLAAQGESEWVIMSVPPGSQGINALVPPGYAIVSVETENKIDRIAIYYDSNNSIWYIEYNDYPGKLRIEIKPLVKDNFQPVKIVGSQGNPLSGPEARELVEGKIPQSILALLDQAKKENLSLPEKKEVIRQIMGLFTYSTNPRLNETLQESDFLTVAFKHYALQCQGASLLNALLSYLLDMPLEVWEGYMGKGDGNFYTPGHAYNRGPEGIEDAVGSLDGRSPFYGLKDVKPEDWEKELRYLEERAARIKDMLSWQEEKRKIETANEKLEEEKKRLEQEPSESRPFNVSNYQQLLKDYAEKLAQLERQKLDRKTIKNLLLWIEGMDFSEVKTAEQLLSRARYVLEILEIIERAFPEEKEQVNSLKEWIYIEFSSVLEKKKFVLEEPFLHYLENDYLPPNAFMEKVNPVKENKQVIDLYTREVAVKLSPGQSAVDYSQGIWVIRDDTEENNPFPFSLWNGDEVIEKIPQYWGLYKGTSLGERFFRLPGIVREFINNWGKEKNGSGGKREYYVSRTTSPEGELILITYSPEGGDVRYRITGPWAERQGISAREYKDQPSVVFLPDGKWFIKADKCFGPAIEENEELREFQDRILDLKYSKLFSDRWIAAIIDEQDKQWIRFVGPLARTNNIEEIKLSKFYQYQLEISPSGNASLGNDLLLIWTPDNESWHFSGNIAQQNELETIWFEPSVYIDGSNNAIIEIGTSENISTDKEGRFDADTKEGAQRVFGFYFIGLGAEYLRINREKYLLNANSPNLLFQADSDGKKSDIVLLHDFSLWENFPFLYEQAQTLASVLWKQGKAITSFYSFLSGGGVIAVFKDKDGAWGISWGKKILSVDGGRYGYQYGLYPINDKRLKKLSVDGFGFLSGEYQTGDGKVETFKVHIGDRDDKGIREIQKKGFSNWLTSEKLFRFYRIAPRTDEMRTDEQWNNFARLAKDNPGEAGEAFSDIVRNMQENNNDLPFFNYDQTKKIIEDNQEMIIGISRDLLPDELAYFTRLLKTLGLDQIIEKIVGELIEDKSGEREDGEEMKYAGDEEWWKGVFDAYTEALKEGHKIKDNFLNPYNFQIQDQEAVKGFNRLLIPYLTKNEADYILELERVYQKITSLGFPLKISALTGDTLKEAIDLLHKKSGIEVFSFDIEFSPLVRNNPIYSILTVLRESPEIFKLNTELFQKDIWKLRPSDYLKQLEKWKEINPKLSEIFKEHFNGDKTLADFWKELKNEAAHDVVILAFLIGIISFSLSYLSEFVRRKETIGIFLGRTTDTIIKEMWNSPWFDGELAGIREFVKKILNQDSGLTQEQMKQIDDFKNILSDKELLIFLITASIAKEFPKKTQVSLKKRLLHLVPFLSAVLSLKINPSFKQRQQMNQTLGKIVSGITDTTTIQEIYQLYEKIMQKYAQDPNPEEEKKPTAATKIEKVEFSSLEEGIKQEITRQKRVVGVSPRKHYPGPNGYPLSQRGDDKEYNGVREYVPGDDLRSIEWKTTARSDKVIVREFIREVEIPISIIIDLGGLADPLNLNTWIKDWVNSLKVLFRDWRVNDKKGDYTLDKVIFVRSDGKFDLVDTGKLFNRHTPSFQEVSKQLVEILKEKYKIVQETSDRGGFEPERRFYTADENRRYTQRLTAIVEDTIAKKQQDEIKGLNKLLKGQDVYLVGFTAEQRKEIGARLRNGIRTIYWEGNQAKRDINKKVSSALISQVPEPSRSNTRSDQPLSVIANNPGGIDLNPRNMDIEIKQGTDSPITTVLFNPQIDLQTFEGFSFQILKMEKLKDLQ